MKVLIIDDDFRVRRTVIDMLELEGYQVLEAETGKEGLGLAASQIPDIILCDILMPEMNGYDVAEKLRSNIATSKIPLIFLTAHSFRGEFAPSLKLGPEDFLAKPITVMVLKKAILHKVYGKSYIRETKMLEILKDISLDERIPEASAIHLRDILGFSDFIVRFSHLLDKDEMIEVASDIHESCLKLSVTIIERDKTTEGE